MDKIQIIDNFLNNTELKILLNIIENKCWKYGHKSGGIEKIDNKFFSIDTSDNFFTEIIEPKIKGLFVNYQKFPENQKNSQEDDESIFIKRSYMHIQCYGQDGCYHLDGTKEKNENIYTVCLYITNLDDSTLENCGGDFLIKTPNNSCIMSVTTKMNRCIIFPSEFFHKGKAYNRFISDKRVCLTWKLREVIFL